jgi:hypothetical protein
MHSARCLIGVTLLSAPLVAQGKVWIVDAASGPGSYAPNLQPAIDAASSGDTILVRSGIYGFASISGKGLALVAEAGAIAKCDYLRVQGIAANATVHIRGLRTGNILAENCLGTLWWEQCTVDAQYGAALDFYQCADIVLSGCVVRGGCGVGLGSSPTAFPGLNAKGGNIFVSACTFIGANGCTGFTPSLPCSGASGVKLSGSTAWLANCQMTGGNGHIGIGPCFFGPPIGGDGVTASAGTLVRTLECTAVGGFGYDCAGPVTTPPIGGVPYEVAADSQHQTLSGTGCTWSVQSPAREFQHVSASLNAEPGALVFLALGLTPAGSYFDAFQGPQLVAFPWFGVVLGTVPPSGNALYSSPFGSLPIGIEGQTFVSQVAVLGASGALQVCGGSAFTILDQTL